MSDQPKTPPGVETTAAIHVDIDWWFDGVPDGGKPQLIESLRPHVITWVKDHLPSV